jgi:hypothetical protein
MPAPFLPVVTRVAAAFGVSVGDITPLQPGKPSRLAPVTLARTLAAAMLLDLGHNQTEVSVLFKVSPSAICHARKRHEQLMETGDPAYLAGLTRLSE